MPNLLLLQTFVPKLLAQEKFIFDELVSYMWTHTLVPHVAASRAKAPQNALTGTSFNKRAGHEAALRKWLESFELVNAQLKAVGRYGHVSTLRQQVLLELLKRVDVLLFHYLLTGKDSSTNFHCATSCSRQCCMSHCFLLCIPW